jgi:Flp pilus assembly protein TadG
MKLLGMSWLRRVLPDERGQAIIFVGLGLTCFIGMTGLSMDLGHGYFAYQMLQASTDAAVLAGAEALPNTSQAATNVTNYSSVAGSYNANAYLKNAAVTTTFSCLTTVQSMGVACEPQSGTCSGGTTVCCPSAGCNAMSVVQTADVPLWFGPIFGVPVFNLKATGTSAMAGGTNVPWNIALVMDTTASMGDSDSGKQCTGTQEHCALAGAQVLLGLLDPCPSGSNCPGTSTPIDSVALFVFPPVTTATASNDYGNGTASKCSDPTISDYIVPTLPSTATYEVVPFSTDYRSTDSSTSLNSGSDLAIAVGAVSGCKGLATPGGAGTYYAEAIYAAQAALMTQQTAVPHSKNAMIILSDGDATATPTYNATKTCTGGSGGWCVSNYSGGDLQPSANGALNGVTGNNPTSYIYPSAWGTCGQAVVAANQIATLTTGVSPGWVGTLNNAG